MQKKPITNKLLWIFAVGQFGWSLLSGIISTWLVHLYTGSAERFLDTNGILSQFISQNPLLASLSLFGIITAVGLVSRDQRVGGVVADVHARPRGHRL